MGIIRVEKSKNYTIMSNYHLRDKSLSLKAKGLLSLMLSLPDDWDYSVAGLVTQVKEERTAVSSAINELIEHGYMTREVIRENGRISDWNYTVYEMPTESVLPSENLIVENLMLENHTQLNTDNNQIKIQKSTGAGALSKNHSQVYKKRESLNDDLESGEIIDEHIRERKKKSEYDKCLAEIDKRYSEPNLYMILVNHLEWSYKSKDPKRIRTLAIYKHRLDELDKLDGNKIAIVQQSINRQWHCFYELQESKSKLSNKREELSDVIKVTTQEEVQNNIAMLRESGKELF